MLFFFLVIFGEGFEGCQAFGLDLVKFIAVGE